MHIPSTPSLWIASEIIPDTTVSLITELLRRSAEKVHAQNAAVWFEGNQNLTPQIGIGPHVHHFLNKFRQPLDQGLISMVFSTGHGLCETGIQQNAQHSDLLDSKLGIHTDAMIAVPIKALDEYVGVITCVHVRPRGSSDPEKEFSPVDLAEFEFLAACFSHLIEASILVHQN